MVLCKVTWGTTMIAVMMIAISKIRPSVVLGEISPYPTVHIVTSMKYVHVWKSCICSGSKYCYNKCDDGDKHNDNDD